MYKIIINKEIKYELSEYLRMMGITDDYIYPDLEHIASSIKNMVTSRYYNKDF